MGYIPNTWDLGGCMKIITILTLILIYAVEVSAAWAPKIPTGTVDESVTVKTNLITVTEATNLDTIRTDTITNNAKVSYTPATPGAIGGITPAAATVTELTVQGGISVVGTSTVDGEWGQWVFKSDNGLNWMILHPEADMPADYTVSIPNVTGTLIIRVAVPIAENTPCTANTVAWNDLYYFVCYSTDHWHKIAFAPW